MVTGNGTTIVSLKGLLTLNNLYEKVKILEIIESRKPRWNTDNSWSKKVV